MTQLEDSTFEQETGSGVSVIDFWATWCVPCKTAGSLFESFAVAYDSAEVKFMKSDVDNCPELSKKFTIRSVPTFLVLKDGIEIGRHFGAANLSAKLTELIEKAKQ